jgi:hypothetical protein
LSIPPVLLQIRLGPVGVVRVRRLLVTTELARSREILPFAEIARRMSAGVSKMSPKSLGSREASTTDGAFVRAPADPVDFSDVSSQRAGVLERFASAF